MMADAGLEGLLDRLAEDDARSLALQRHLHEVARDVSQTVKGIAERVYDATEHRFAYADRSDTAGTLDRHVLLDLVGGAEKHRADIVLLKVHGHGHDSVLELQEFAGLAVAESVDAGHAIADLEDLAYLLEMEGIVDTLQLTQEDIGNLAGFDIVLRH